MPAGTKQQDATHPPTGQEPPEDHDRLDGLSHPHFVTQQTPGRPRCGTLFDDANLVGPKPDAWRHCVGIPPAVWKPWGLEREPPPHPRFEAFTS